MNSRYEYLFAKYNQYGVIRHPAQHSHKYKKVLFVCSAGILRSATAAHVFSAEPYNWNTRTAGMGIEFALNPVSEALILWADKIYCMEQEHLDDMKSVFGERLEKLIKARNCDDEIFIEVLNIPDIYEYRSPELIKLLKEKVKSE